jgi:hypothetical protein
MMQIAVMNLEMEHAGNMVFSFTGAWLSLSEKPRHSVVSFPAAPTQAQLIPETDQLVAVSFL